MVIYELCCLEPLFKPQNQLKLMGKITTLQKIPNIPDLYSDDLNRIVKSMLTIDQKLRPSVSEIINDPYLQVARKYFLETSSVPY